MTTKPGDYDFTIYQGATFSQSIAWQDENGTPINVTGSAARMQMRASQDEAAPFITLTTENGGIALGGAAGTVTLTISAADTSTLTATGGVYDLEIISPGGIVTRLLQGAIIIIKEVTR